MADYLSDTWFELVADVLAAQGEPGADDLIVSYQHQGSALNRPHTQCFSTSGLVGWTPGLHPQPDLLVSRRYDIDRGDLLARISPSLVLAETTVQPRQPAPATDVLGILGALDREVDGVPPSLTITFSIEVPDAPVGEVLAHYELVATEIRPGTTDRSPDIEIRCYLEELLGWRYRSQPLFASLLLSAGPFRHLEGDIFRISALTGIVSSPDPTDDQELPDHLLRYGRLRQTDGFRQIVDTLDAFTSN